MSKKVIKMNESVLHRIVKESVNEAIRQRTILSGDRAGQQEEYNTEDKYPGIMGRCKLAMDRLSAQIGNLGILSMNAYGAERQDWERSFNNAKRQLEQIYEENLLPIYKELKQNGIQPMVNGEPYTDWGFGRG